MTIPISSQKDDTEVTSEKSQKKTTKFIYFEML